MIASPYIVIDSESSTVIDTESSILSVFINKAPSASNDSSATVTMITHAYTSPSSSPFELSINYETFSAVANAVTTTATSYTSNYFKVLPSS